MERLTPWVGLTAQENVFIKRLVRGRRLFGILHALRWEAFDDTLQEALNAHVSSDGGGGCRFWTILEVARTTRPDFC